MDCEFWDEDYVGIDYGNPVRTYDRDLPLYVSISHPFCNHVQPGMGADWSELFPGIVCAGISGISYDGLCGALCGTGVNDPSIGQSEFCPLWGGSLHRFIVFQPYENRKFE